MWVRPPVVAGRFYPSDPDQLRDLIYRFLAAADRPEETGRPKGLIVPHAGYVFSGPVAASGYVCLVPGSAEIHRVILLGTCHSPGIDGLATTSAGAFLTPLGKVQVDTALVEQSLSFDQVQVDDPAHGRDHALEVQLPFLQVILESFAIVPYLVGRADASTVAEVLEALWDGDSTLIVVSSDLSHHQTYEQAQRLDRATALAIEQFDSAALRPNSACGRNAIAGLLQAAGNRRLRCRRLDLRSSGDTTGPRDRVVGYGSWLFLSS
jgi:AmmeMemoRadiSam system protein B